MLLCSLLVLTLAVEVDEVPLVGRPADLPFSGASASFHVTGAEPEYRVPFTLQTTAAPAEVEALAPLTFTVTVQAAGRVHNPPARLDLRQVPAFARSFHIEDVTDGKKETISPAVWRWSYRLKPRSAGVLEVPGLPFVFYNPDLRPTEKAFQVIWTDPIPLRVLPADRQLPPVDAPGVALEFAGGSGLLAAQPEWAGPGIGLVAVVILVPPLGCTLWYLLWRRLYPDVARMTRQRRSRAARHALATLTRLGKETGRVRAEAITRALADYLRERFDLPSAEPTPAEAAAWFARLELPSELVDQVSQLLERCAELRFRPGDSETTDLGGAVETWIVAVEESPCPSSS
jgi:hypothetical protein